MSTYTLNYAIWTGAVGVVLEYYKRKGGMKWSTLLVKGFGEKALIGLLSSYLQQELDWTQTIFTMDLSLHYLQK